jgi:hypothetical protein
VKTIYNLLDIYKGMKLIDVINESEEDRLYKKGKAIYTALKRGKIDLYLRGKENEPATFTYTLSDSYAIVLSRDGEVFITPNEIKIREENKECMGMGIGLMEMWINHKFKNFNIRLVWDNFNPRRDLDTYIERMRNNN